MKETILVVEDDLAIVKGLETNLRYEGFEVVTAADGERDPREIRQVPAAPRLADLEDGPHRVLELLEMGRDRLEGPELVQHPHDDHGERLEELPVGHVTSGVGGLVDAERVEVAAQADAVEVVRGPASNLYGSNALHGMINVIVAMPERARRVDHRTKTSLRS